jgi:hypothetical protein
MYNNMLTMIPRAIKIPILDRHGSQRVGELIGE